jgi:hypothetical protein
VAGRSRYRAYATQCVQLAADTTDEKRKLLLLEMARHWLELAEEAAAATPPRPQGGSSGSAADD